MQNNILMFHLKIKDMISEMLLNEFDDYVCDHNENEEQHKYELIYFHGLKMQLSYTMNAKYEWDDLILKMSSFIDSIFTKFNG